MATSTIDHPSSEPAVVGGHGRQGMTQPQAISQPVDGGRKGVRRTVWILGVVVVFFFALSFLQILLMK